MLENLNYTNYNKMKQPKYKLKWLNTNATDSPGRVTNLETKESRYYGVEGLPWKLLKNDQEVLHYVFTNFKSDIKSVAESAPVAICTNPYTLKNSNGRELGPYCKTTKGGCKCYDKIPNNAVLKL